MVKRKSLPMVLSWASTEHKMHSCTVQHEIVYLDMPLPNIAPSRVKLLDLIEEPSTSKRPGKKIYHGEKNFLKHKNIHGERKKKKGTINSEVLNAIHK